MQHMPKMITYFPFFCLFSLEKARYMPTHHPPFLLHSVYIGSPLNPRPSAVRRVLLKI